MAAVELELGFSDPVRESAWSFRSILDAMAQPGRSFEFQKTVNGIANLHGGAMTVALTLLDQETPYWLSDGLEDAAVRQHLAFHAGATLASRVNSAQFVFCTPAEIAGTAPDLSAGTPEYPDRSASLIVTVDALEGGAAVTLSGPGIEGKRDFSPIGVGADAWGALRQNAASYPLGFDTIFATPKAVAALPRSTKIHGMEG